MTCQFAAVIIAVGVVLERTGYRERKEGILPVQRCSYCKVEARSCPGEER